VAATSASISPAQAGGDVVQDKQRGQGTQEGSGPVGTVDGEVHPAPVLRRDHLVDRGVDGGVLTANAGSRDDTGEIEEDEPVTACGCRRGQPTADQIDGERHHEQVFPAQLVRKPAEEERAENLADQVPGGDVGDRSRRHVQRGLLSQVRADVAGDRDFQAVQDPRDAERHHQPGVEFGPRQPIYSCRNQAPDRGGAAASSRALLSSRPPSCGDLGDDARLPITQQAKIKPTRAN
jgi:hypothetical protein